MRCAARRELPPTAGLPLRWRDLLAGRPDFAAALAAEFGIPAPLLTCSGTAALIVALRTLQQQQPQRDEVIVPAFTCPLVALAAWHCPPLKIVPCDLLPGRIDFDPRQLSQLCTTRTLAVVVTHLAGRVADAATAARLSARCGAVLIEDCAQALGARRGGQSVGLIGEIAFFSLAMGKGLTTAEGGILFSRLPTLHAALARQIASDLPHRPLAELGRIATLWGYRLFYHPDRLEWVYGRPLRRALARGDWLSAVGENFTAAAIPLYRLGRYRQRAAAAALRRLPAWLLQGRERAQARVALLARLPGVTVIQDRHDGVWPFMLLLMPDRASRDAALERLWCAGLGVSRLFISTLRHYPDVLPLLSLRSQTPNADRLAACSLTLSNSPWLSDADFARILSALGQVLPAPG